MNADQIISSIKAIEKFLIRCPRCGSAVSEAVKLDAISRRADVHICSFCGTEEALCDFFKVEDSINDWYVVKEFKEGN